MARCELGYLCDVCGREVEDMEDSDLYLRYVLGEVDPETLHVQPERHVGCNPTLAQFIVAEEFPPVRSDGPFDKTGLDPAYVAEEEARVTRGYRRLLELPGLGLPITEYPLPEVRERWINAVVDRDRDRAREHRPSAPPMQGEAIEEPD
jgi:hypothetical protein